MRIIFASVECYDIIIDTGTNKSPSAVQIENPINPITDTISR